jgi:hypothetical protein
MAVDIFDREVAISRLALIHHAEHDTHTLCRSDTRFYDADQTHMMSNLFFSTCMALCPDGTPWSLSSSRVRDLY